MVISENGNSLMGKIPSPSISIYACSTMSFCLFNRKVSYYFIYIGKEENSNKNEIIGKEIKMEPIEQYEKICLKAFWRSHIKITNQ